MKYLSGLFVSTLLVTSLSAVDFELSVGAHDFLVSDIKDDTSSDGINAGDSHTLGLNIGIYVKHKTSSNINLLAKAEAFLDHDKDKLDPDHIPIWFDFLLDFDGPIYSINQYNSFKWYILMDNKQNTVSCVEREVRQHIGVGYDYSHGKFTFDTNVYAGFYYIELDDDTPLSRGYTNQELDDGEASIALELELQYVFNDNWSVHTKAKQYLATKEFKELETNYEFLLSYNGVDSLRSGTSLNFKVKNIQYNFDRFNNNVNNLSVVPWDNDTLIQLYLSTPFSW